MKIYEAKEWSSKIVEHESEKQTEKSVFINGIRHAKVSNYSAFFNTKDEAKQYLDFCNSKFSSINAQLKNYNDKLQKITES